MTHFFCLTDERFIPSDVDGRGLLSVIFTLMQFAMSLCFTCVNLQDLVLGEIQSHPNLDNFKQSVNIASNVYAIYLVCNNMIQPSEHGPESFADWMWHHGINIIQGFFTVACYGWHIVFYITSDRGKDALEMSTKLCAVLALLYCMDLKRSSGVHNKTNCDIHRMFLVSHLVNWVMEQILAPVIFPGLVVELANCMTPALRVWMFSNGFPNAFMFACRKMHELLALTLSTRDSTQFTLDTLDLSPELSVILLMFGGIGLSFVYWTHSSLPHQRIPQMLQLIITLITCVVCIRWLVKTPSRTKVRCHDFVYHFLLWFGSLIYCMLNLWYEPTFDVACSALMVVSLGVTLVKDYWDNPWRWWLAVVSMMWTLMLWTQELSHIERLRNIWMHVIFTSEEHDTPLEWLQALFPLLPEFFLFVAGTLLRKPKLRNVVPTDYLTFNLITNGSDII
jgi:hypothetical protein